MPNVPFSVVVAVPAPSVDEVPQANPRTVDEALPSDTIVPLNVIEDDATDVDKLVTRPGAFEGAEKIQPLKAGAVTLKLLALNVPFEKVVVPSDLN